jgi:hypothetical protein
MDTGIRKPPLALTLFAEGRIQPRVTAAAWRSLRLGRNEAGTILLHHRIPLGAAVLLHARAGTRGLTGLLPSP